MAESQSTINIVIETPIVISSNQEHNDLTTKSNPHLTPPQSAHCLSLTKVHAGYFRICLSFTSQALLWKVLSERTIYPETLRGHVVVIFPSTAFLLLWFISLSLLIIFSFLYILRSVFHFQIVRYEFGHHAGVNYMFFPFISWLILLKSAPIISPKDIWYQIIWWFFITPIAVLDVKTYGQWFTTEKRFLSVVANPTSQISVIANLVGAWTAAEMGWTECGVCLFTLGMTHYLVVFITLYQRLSGSESLPARLRPLLFLFVATPSTASLAWSSIAGSFGTPSKMLFFLSLFLFIALVSHSIHSFPVTFLTLASAEYAQQVKGAAPSGLFLTLSLLSQLVFVCLMLYTGLNVGVLFHYDDPFLVAPK